LYFNYDARGHAGRVIDGPKDLTYTFDGAERVTQIRETGSGFLGCLATWTSGPRRLKTFAYAASNGTGDWRLGKLQTAKRYNYPVIGTATYTAHDGAERVTQVRETGGGFLGRRNCGRTRRSR
jgi:hypothetical protein